MIKITVSYNSYEKDEIIVLEKIIELLERSVKEKKGISWDIVYTLGGD